jgi:hypothetical protein
VALILAVNPGNVHNPTLSRLARELRGCEIIGAESCAVAIRAIQKRVPDILLLPATRARDEADLREYLMTIRGGVPTLKLPPVESADPLDLAKQIRALLTGAPATVPASIPASAVAAAPVRASADLLAAAAVAVSWIRARRGQWSEPLEPYEFDAPEPSEPPEPEYYEPIALDNDPHGLNDDAQPEAAPGPSGRQAGGAAFLPRAAAAAAVVGLVGTVAWYWTQTDRRPSRPVESAARSDEALKPVETAAPPAPGQPTAQPEPLIEATIAAPPPQPVAVISPFAVTISAGGEQVPLDPQGRAMLVPGMHRLRFQNSERGYDETRAVQVRPGETTTLTLSPGTTISVRSNEPAEVLVDGVRVGDTPYEGRMGLGAHTVTVKAAGAERQTNVNATSKPVQLEVDFSKP